MIFTARIGGMSFFASLRISEMSAQQILRFAQNDMAGLDP